MRTSSSYRRWISIGKMVRFKHRRLLAICLVGVAFVTIFHYCVMQLSMENIIQESTLKVLNIIEKNTSSLLLPDKSTIILQPTSPNTCKGTGKDHFLLFMFITSPENELRRGIIRQQFADGQAEWESSILALNERRYPAGESIKFLFFIGLPNNEDGKERLKEEWESHGDIVLDKFNESYLNLTLKTLRMLKWVNRNCQEVRYLAKIDDDVHFNMPNLLQFLSQYNETAGKNLIAGRTYSQIPIDDDPMSKWFTPKFVWTGLLPDFVAGFFYILGSQAKNILYTNALETPLFHLEDVYITGIVRSKHTNISVVNIPGIYEHWPFSYNLFTSCFVKSLVAVHPLSARQMKCWGQFTSSTFQCGTWPIITYCI